MDHKRAKFEALANSQPTKATEDKQQKKVSVDEMLELQKEEYQLLIQQLLEQEILRKEEIHELVQKWQQENMDTETRLRRAETELNELKRPKTEE